MPVPRFQAMGSAGSAQILANAGLETPVALTRWTGPSAGFSIVNLPAT